MNHVSRLLQAVARSSILWGCVVSGAFFGLIRGPLSNAFLQRYTTTHPVEYVETVRFFIGMAFLVIKAIDVRRQYRGLGGPLLGAIPRGGQTVADCEALLERLRVLSGPLQSGYFVRRLRDALEYIRQRRSADGLDKHLEVLAERDADRAYADQGLLRLIIWAIPILGFLGTVVGITMALMSLRPEAIEQSMIEVTAGLGVKFDTTALALTLSMGLMFVHFFVDRAESALMNQVSRGAEAELVGRFEQMPAGADGQVVAVQRMAEAMLQAVEELVRRQAALWQASLAEARQEWGSMADRAGKHLQTALAGALAESLRTHAQQVGAIEQAAAEQNRKHWDGVQRAMLHNAESITSLQTSLGRQGEVLGRAIQAAADVTRLEDALNHNLAALAGAKNFEETVMSLAAAIHLLTSRLGDLPGDAAAVRLEPHRRTGQAA